jgi:hypothetical protein
VDSGRSRSEAWLDDQTGPWPGEADNELAGGRRARRRAARAAQLESKRAQAMVNEDWLHHPDHGTGRDPAEFDVTDFRDRLLSGPNSELYGVARGRDVNGDDTGGYTAFDARVLDPESPAERSDPSIPSMPSFPSLPSLPRQAAGEYQEESSGLVRPYFRTRGRTRPSYDLAIEALVQTSERGRALERVRVPEHRSICDLCLDTRSIAEVAALLRLPLGVVRVLVGDVAGLGLVLVHSANTAVGDRPSIEFMERVLSGLRRI